MKKDLPIYDIVLNEEDLTQGVGMISLVDEPAIGVKWIKMAKDSNLFKLSKDKQLLYGPFLIPNMLIYRWDEDFGEYYVRFSKEEIEKISTKFNEDLNNKNINFMHTDKRVEAFVAQNWVIEGDSDKSKSLGFDLPEGTWFGAVKVKDINFWNEVVKKDEVSGFSVEILADLKLKLKNKSTKMEELKKKKKYIAKQKFNEAVETEAGEVIIVAESIEVGQECIVVMDDLTAVDTYDGQVEMDGSVITIEGGEITAVEPMEAPVEEAPAEEEMAVEPTQSAALSAEEVNKMIDVRFGEIMEELTRLKTAIDGKDEEFKKVIDEKFSTTPAAQSITKKPEIKVEDKFKAMEEKIKSFAKTR